MRKVALGTTFEVYFNTVQFSTGAPDTLDSGAMELRRHGNDTEITAGLTLSTDHDTVVGFNELTIVAATAGLVAGEIYDVVIGVGTIDSVSAVGYIVGQFQVETAAELAEREYKEKKYGSGHVLGASGSHSATVWDLTGVIDVTTPDDTLIGEILELWDADTGVHYLARCTDFVNSTLLATVEALNSGVTLPTPAAGDMLWRNGQFTSNVIQISDDTTAANNLELFTEGTALGTLPKVNTTEVLGTAQTAGDLAALINTVDANVDILVSGIISGFTAVTGTLTTTACSTDITGYANDELIGRVIIFVGGTANGQAAAITDYASASGLVSFSGGITTAPANLDAIIIV